MTGLRRPLVIFDLDGTIVDTMPATFRCFEEALTAGLGRTPSREEIHRRMGPADQHIIADWVGPERADEAVQILYRCYAREFAAAGPFPGMVELIRKLRDSGRAVALFTGRGRPSTDLILRSMGLVDLFQVTVCGEEVPRSKPAPDGINRILEHLGRGPDEAVYVGDAVMDVTAARAAGAVSVAVTWGSPEPDRLRELDVPLAETVAELEALLLGEDGG